MRQVQMLAHSHGLNPGEVASFAAAVAARLISSGQARVWPVPKPEEPRPALVTREEAQLQARPGAPPAKTRLK
jgi:hypothetical protein